MINFSKLIEEKREWNAYKKRVNAFPANYRMVYHEIQKYLCHHASNDVGNHLYDIIELFEEGIRCGKDPLEVAGSNVAEFCDTLVNGDSNDYL